MFISTTEISYPRSSLYNGRESYCLPGTIKASENLCFLFSVDVYVEVFAVHQHHEGTKLICTLMRSCTSENPLWISREQISERDCR